MFRAILKKAIFNQYHFSCGRERLFLKQNGYICHEKVGLGLNKFFTSVSTNNGKNKMTPIDLCGVFPPIVTPFARSGKLDIDSLAENIKHWDTIAFAGYVLLGSNGENALLSSDEKVQLATHLKYLTEKPVIAGSGCESTYQTIELSKGLAAAGADALLVVTPCYYRGRMSDQALINHYTKVADSSPVPVILYSVPANTNLDLPAPVAVTLAKHDNIIGMKDSDGNITKLASIVHQTKEENFRVIAGSAGFLLPALLMGCSGGICALANTLGEECCELFKLYNANRLEEARELQYRLIGPNTAVTRSFGVAGLKYSMSLFGYQGGHVREPLLPLTEAEMRGVTDAFTSQGFIPTHTD